MLILYLFAILILLQSSFIRCLFSWLSQHVRWCGKCHVILVYVLVKQCFTQDLCGNATYSMVYFHKPTPVKQSFNPSICGIHHILRIWLQLHLFVFSISLNYSLPYKTSTISIFLWFWKMDFAFLLFRSYSHIPTANLDLHLLTSHE